MLWVDTKYANLIGGELENFKIISNRPYTANYRCFVCGDSSKRKRRARGYLLEKDDKIISYCHNCGAYFNLSNFLKEKNPRLFNEYRLECLREKGQKRIPAKKEPVFAKTVFKPKPLDLGPMLTDCNDDVLKYVIKRRIPEKFYSSLHSNQSILNITKQIDKYHNLNFDADPVLVIPFYNKDREFSHICCRAIDSDAAFRYYVFELDDKTPSLWGLEFIDWNQPIFVFEGPIDAMCLPNSLAIGGSVGISSLNYIKRNINNMKDVCFIYDNEMFKNSQILKQVKLRIKQGFSVVIYDKFFNGKDANEVIVNDRMNPTELLSYYQSRTFAGLSATLELAYQAKIKFH